MDRWGRGTHNWTIPAGATISGDYVVRATATSAVNVDDVSNDPFLVANSGTDYYVNDGNTVGDELTTTIGDNAIWKDYLATEAAE